MFDLWDWLTTSSYLAWYAPWLWNISYKWSLLSHSYTTLLNEDDKICLVVIYALLTKLVCFYTVKVSCIRGSYVCCYHPRTCNLSLPCHECLINHAYALLRVDYALEESDPQWVASEFVDSSGFAELSDFPSHQGKPRILNSILVFS